MNVRTETHGPVGRLVIDRPAVANAFDGPTVAALHAGLDTLLADPAVRVIVLSSTGRVFSAGADLAWMRRMAEAGPEENHADAAALAALLAAVDRSPKPVVARIQGASMAGATGLVAASDVAIASDAAVFAVTEVRLGLIPAVIAPYLVRAMGVRQVRRLALTAERFDAATAAAVGLVHAAVPADALDARVEAVVADLLKASPAALAAAKALFRAVETLPDDALVAETARRIAERRASADAREGLAAFLAKRTPDWSL
ncbi:enoyl-CoA hydratase-related protein [Mongoliimonas terrestris]|uniref:enoyl-CoA hydratase-related protein n=1 Tax=Mongoliimonas terrestris TaxID=1709001 RepID=UPI0009498D86|nr:enoyl-CoA hydratase-related protein [Mongoliimonas terrestris]